MKKSSRLTNFLVSFDSYGEAISMNYRGNTFFKTGLGSLLTLALKSFLLVFLTTECIKLFTYKNPQITQYIIIDPRASTEKVNLGEAQGLVSFALVTP